MKTRHGGEFIGEAVISPDGPFAAWTMDCVYESAETILAASLLSDKNDMELTHSF